MNHHAVAPDGRILLDGEAIERTLSRVAHEIIERNEDLDEVALVGIHTRGVPLAQRLRRLVAERAGIELDLGQLDITFHRDDVHVRDGRSPRRAQPIVHDTKLDFDLEGRTVILVDDVLYTGRTVRAAIDALLEYGRPARVQLAVLADRGHRELPIRPDYVGKNLPTARDERVQVQLLEVDEVDRVVLVSESEEGSMSDRSLQLVPGELRPPTGSDRRHLLSIRDLDRGDIERLLATAHSFARSQERDTKKLPTLRGRLVVNMFFESSTRTSASFELAAKRLSADTMSMKASGSSVEKGESLKDTALTLSAYDPDVIVIRHEQIGAPQLVASVTDAHVVNAGDGKHQHPTQALLDLYSIQESLGRLDGVHVAIVGDVLHSRVARSLIQALELVGASVILVGPPPLLPPELGERSYDIASIRDADIVYVLRMQRERMEEGANYVPSMREYSALWCVTPDRLRAGQKVMHPGPMNRGVEIDARVADSSSSLIVDQVRAGLVIRMAVLYDLLTTGPVAVETAVGIA